VQGNRNENNNNDNQPTGNNGNFGGNQGYSSKDFYSRRPPSSSNNFGNNGNFGNDFIDKHFNRNVPSNGNSMNWPAAMPQLSANDQDVQAGPGARKREKRNAPWVKTVSSLHYYYYFFLKMLGDHRISVFISMM
jgi:hypothetical protein